MKNINYYNFSIVGLTITYALFASIFLPTLDTFWLVSGVIALISLVSKKYTDFYIVIFVQVNMLLHLTLYPNISDFRHIAQVTALSAYTLLCVTLLMGPLARFSRYFARILKHRRHVGISVFLLAMTHAMFIITQYYNANIQDIYSVKSNYFGGVGLLIFSALALTSTDYAKNKISLKIYNVIHTSLFVFFLFYSILIINFVQKSVEMWTIAVVFVASVFWLALAPWSLPRKVFKAVNGWKQLHYLVYVGFAFVSIHAWSGYFSLQPTPMQITFLVMTSAVFIVHIAGWVKRISKKKSTSNP